MNLPERITEKIAVTDDCWLWLGAKNRRGYGTVTFDGSRRLAHRVVYAILVGEIPVGHHLHHRETCPHHCVNPDHLTPITRREHCLLHPDNARRNWERLRAQTHCKRGHEFTEENTKVKPMRDGYARVCRTCQRERDLIYRRARRRAESFRAP